MSSPQPSILPPLPLEVKGHILSLCDQGTLAVASRVSLAFLELAGPILYEHVHIDGLDSLFSMLNSRVSNETPPIRCSRL